MTVKICGIVAHGFAIQVNMSGKSKAADLIIVDTGILIDAG